MNIQLRSKNLPLTTRAAEGLERRRWCVAEIEAAVRAGVIASDERFELIGGEIVPMPPCSARHEAVKTKLIDFFKRVAPKYLEIAPRASLVFDEATFVEPDFCIFRNDVAFAPLEGPAVSLVIEIADASLAYDRGRKIGVYAAAGVREVWVIDAKKATTWLHRRLSVEGYGETAEMSATQLIAPLLAPELAVRLSDLGLTADGFA